MTPQQHRAINAVDVLIVGGGCAGLSVARELATRGYQGKVVIVEPRDHYTNDRSWSFWAPKHHDLASWVYASWSHWTVGLDGGPSQSRSSQHYTYQHIRSIDFYRNSIKCLEPHHHVQLVLGESVIQIEKNASHWHVQTPTQTFATPVVIDTRPPETSRLLRSTLYQCFVGYEIEHPQPLPDTTSVELMTDMRVVTGEFGFTYALALTSHRQLIEMTYFARSPMDYNVIEQELANRLRARGISDATIIRKECGVLPMGLPPAQHSAQGIYAAGTGGGALRPSSGFGFLRIQRWAKQFATALIEQKPLALHNEISGPLRYMDQLFLQVLAKAPSRAPELFNALFTKVEPDKLIRFMNEESSYADLFAVISSMPKKPFLLELLRLAKP